MNFFDQHRASVSPGPEYVHGADTVKTAPVAYPVRYIAFYLPQFHAVAENDEWWGKGFTEWSNVTKSVPRYLGHLQPRLPSDLGFYDLRDPDVIRAQARLALLAGINAFCIHDYWFAGRKILETPLQLILRNQDIDIGFCLNWANENWTRRWDGLEQDVLLKQEYSPSDLTGYIRSILPALSDKRYLRIGKRPLIMVYRPECIPDSRRMFDAWRTFLDKEGFGNPFLVKAQNFAHPSRGAEHHDPRPHGMDAAAGFPPHAPVLGRQNDVQFQKLFDLNYQGNAQSYMALAQSMLDSFSSEYVTFPGVCPGWDNEARKPGRGVSFYGTSPARYEAWLQRASEQVLSRNLADERLVFINAWNEWAEGAVLEPDRHFGHAYLAKTRSTLDRLTQDATSPEPPLEAGERRSSITRLGNRIRRKADRIARFATNR